MHPRYMYRLKTVQILLTLIRLFKARTLVFERDMFCPTSKEEIPPVECISVPNLEEQHQ